MSMRIQLFPRRLLDDFFALIAHCFDNFEIREWDVVIDLFDPGDKLRGKGNPLILFNGEKPLMLTAILKSHVSFPLQPERYRERHHDLVVELHRCRRAQVEHGAMALRRDAIHHLYAFVWRWPARRSSRSMPVEWLQMTEELFISHTAA